MPNLPTYIAKITTTIIILTYFSIFFIFTIFPIYNKILAQTSTFSTFSFQLCWKLETDKTMPHELASDNESNIYLPSSGGEIESINSKTGMQNWKIELGGKITVSPIIDEKNLYLVSRSEKKTVIRSLSKSFGITNWQTNFDFSEDVFLVKDNNKLILASKIGKIFALDKITGAVIWNKNLEQKLSTAPILFKNQIVFGVINKKIFFILSTDGTILDELNVPFFPSIIFKVKDNFLFWGDYRGNIYFYNLTTRKIIWKIRSGAEISNISISQQQLIISSLDNFIFLISIEKGKLIWKKRFNGRLLFSSIITNSTTADKYIIVITIALETADVINIKNGKLVNQLFIGNNNYSINKPLFLDGLLIFPTIRGLIAFTDSNTKCLSR